MSIVKKLVFFLFFVWSSWVFGHELSLREKIGQMLIFGFQGKEASENSPIAQAIKKYNLGGVILFDYDYQKEIFDKNIENPYQVRVLNHKLQSITEKANKNHHRPSLPLLISVDYEGGEVNRLSEEYGFPMTYSAKKMGQMTKSEVAHQAKSMAETLNASGFNLDFAPDIDVDVNPDNPIIGKLERSFSSNPELVSQYASIFSAAFKNKGIACAYKHFPGHGSSSTDSHLGFVDVTATWTKSELLPFQHQLASPNHCNIIMSAHVVNRNLDASGLPATLSYPILTKILRHQLKFDGVIISDDMQMKAIADNYGLKQALTKAINAGVDMFIFGNQLVDTPQDPKEVIDIIEKQVQKGKISKKRINDAYQRIVKLKKILV